MTAAPRPHLTKEPVDPDAETPLPAPRQRAWRGQGPVIGMVALGGGLGAAARYGAALLWPTAAPAAFPWTTLAVNVVGCAVIGVFMVVITDVWAAHRLVRPFFGTGVLGGFTTFSTYAVDIERLVDGGRPGLGLLYLGLTLLAALLAVWAAASTTRRLVRWRAERTGGTRP
ncbi:fluoride efflux transporter CrcB [Streptomyces boninensis]|uniref:fluoride efflux transporter CrcB n=1 Tax=Streptomyces boninensis TaxID=2039455 RepID=UPI003B21CB02